MGANSLDILNNLDSSYCVVGRKALNSLFFLGNNFGFGCYLVYQGRLGVRHVLNIGLSGSESSLETGNVTVQALKLFANVLQDRRVLI